MRAEYREEPCRSALNRVKGMGFGWSLNPYMGCVHRCTFCYVRAFELRADRPSGDATERRSASRSTSPRCCGASSRAAWEHETVAIGAATDPYQPAEGRYRLTRACIEALLEAHNPFAIITRGPLIVRDLDVLQEASRRADVRVTFSVPTLDEEVWRTTEPGTAPPRQRLRVLKRLVDGGINAAVGMAPILPGISDKPELLARGGEGRPGGRRDRGVWANVLNLRPGTREHFMAHLEEDWPEEAERYERLYRRRAYLGKDVTGPVQTAVAELKREYGVSDRRRKRLGPPPEPEQLSLAV